MTGRPAAFLLLSIAAHGAVAATLVVTLGGGETRRPRGDDLRLELVSPLELEADAPPLPRTPPPGAFPESFAEPPDLDEAVRVKEEEDRFGPDPAASIAVGSAGGPLEAGVPGAPHGTSRRIRGAASPSPAAAPARVEEVARPPRLSSRARPIPGSCPAPDFPSRERRRGTEGRVVLRVSVGIDGAPTAVDIETSSGCPALDAAAVDAVHRWSFEPARWEGSPVPDTVLVPVRFVIDAIATSREE